LKEAVTRLPEDKWNAIEEDDRALADNARIAHESSLKAREVPKRKAIIHEEVLLDYDAWKLEQHFQSLDAKEQRTAETPLIVQCNEAKLDHLLNSN
jgi:apolipoprotein N-acyltransferase